MELVDTHAHLDDPRFASDFTAVVRRAVSAGVTRVLAVGVGAESSATCLAIADAQPGWGAAVGIHPNHVAEEPADAWDRVVAFEPRALALGETGLDRHWDRTPFATQEEFFARHLALSRRTGKPVVIHCREADADVERMLRTEFDAHGPIRGVLHSFGGGPAFADACLAMGLYLSFAGMATYKNADAIRDVARVAPADRILVETDCPYLAPVPVRGKRNEPAHVAHTASLLAEVRGETLDAFAARTTENARRLFRFPDRT